MHPVSLLTHWVACASPFPLPMGPKWKWKQDPLTSGRLGGVGVNGLPVSQGLRFKGWQLARWALLPAPGLCTHMHTHTQCTRAHTHTHVHIHTRAHARTRTRTHARMHTRAHTCTYTRARACAHAHTHMCMHARTHTREEKQNVILTGCASARAGFPVQAPEHRCLLWCSLPTRPARLYKCVLCFSAFLFQV